MMSSFSKLVEDGINADHAAKIAGRIRIFGPILIVVSLCIVVLGTLLQYKLSHHAEFPLSIAQTGAEKHLANSVQTAAVGLLNTRDTMTGADQLVDLKKIMPEWEEIHDKLKKQISSGKVPEEIAEPLRDRAFPLFDNIQNRVYELTGLLDTQPNVSLQNLKPLIDAVESDIGLYLFYLNHLDLKLADVAHKGISQLQFIEGILVILVGFLLLGLTLWLLVPTGITINSLMSRLYSSLDDINEKNSTLAELYFTAQERCSQINDSLRALTHDVRNPVGTMMGYAELLKATPGITKEHLKLVDVIERNGKLTLGLLEEFLEFAKAETRTEKASVERFSIADLAKNLEETFKLRAQRKNLAFSITAMSCVLDHIVTDRRRLSRILENLISNAIKYTNKGDVQICFSRESGQNGDDLLQVVVSDTGIGIKQEDLTRIFDPFYVVERGPDSTGLGLAIVKQLVISLGGDVEATNSPNRGTNFTVRIPWQLEIKVEKENSSELSVNKVDPSYVLPLSIPLEAKNITEHSLTFSDSLLEKENHR